MVLSPEIMIPPRHNSFSSPDTSPPSPSKSHWWFFTSKLKLASNSGSSFGSTHTVATQKLRESKWFDQDEERLFCAVVEAGFIVEIMQKDQTLINDGEEIKSHFGIVSIEVKKNKLPNASTVYIYTVSKLENRMKVLKFSIADLWSRNYKIRINNMNDRSKKINSEKEIKNQILYALKTRTVFHNSLHFVDYCRYGDNTEARKRQVSESVKWGTVGMNAGIFLLQREKSNSFSK